jgi:hypothetical protein
MKGIAALTWLHCHGSFCAQMPIRKTIPRRCRRQPPKKKRPQGAPRGRELGLFQAESVLQLLSMMARPCHSQLKIG